MSRWHIAVHFLDQDAVFCCVWGCLWVFLKASSHVFPHSPAIDDETRDLDHWHNFRLGAEENACSCLKWRPSSVQHAPTIWPKTQEDPEVYCFKQELPCHSDPAAQWRVCGVHALGGEHRAGMFGGSCTETWVKRGMCVFSANTSGDCSDSYAFRTLTPFHRSIS